MVVRVSDHPSLQSEAAAQFVTFLTEWYIAFPAHANHTVHLVGESFGAQYVAHVAAALRAPQPAGRLPVRVGSLTTVSGWLGMIRLWLFVLVCHLLLYVAVEVLTLLCFVRCELYLSPYVYCLHLC